MQKLLATVATTIMLATPALAQFTGETVSFPLGIADVNNHVEFVTRVKNTNFFSESAMKHSDRAANIAIFDIINGGVTRTPDDVSTVNTVKFYYANCGTLEYSLYAQTTGDRASLNDNIVYATSSVTKPAGGTTPEGIRAGEICRDLDLLYK